MAASPATAQYQGTGAGGANGNPCGNCGGNHRRGNCPAAKMTCHNCGKVGHLQRFCHSAKNFTVAAQPMVAMASVAVPHADAENKADLRYGENLPYVPPVVMNSTKRVTMRARDHGDALRKWSANLLPDSGSSVTMMPTLQAKKAGFRLQKLRDPLHLTVAGLGGVSCTHRFQTAISARVRLSG